MARTTKAIELLAPARDAGIATIAIDYGADAVYMGASSHGARSAAANSLTDIARAVDHAHRYGARIYCTINTLVYDNELMAVERLISDLYRIGVDALIVQDMAILRLDIPPIALHASTQCDTRDAAKAKFLQDVGFSQIVLARELTLKEISAINEVVDVPLEAFVHGALCVSYSGDCQASWMFKRRSANRGECAQMCRLPYELTDAEGRVIATPRGKHLLSLKDMNRSALVGQMLDAGVSSFKIEGRLKDEIYVKNVVSAYRQILDRYIDANPTLFHRLSFGKSTAGFIPDLSKSFNRGYTSYFANGVDRSEKIASIGSPKSIGTKVGEVKTATGKIITARLSQPLSNGDGLGFFDRDGSFQGFRLNRVEGNRLFPASHVEPAAGTALYRNKDKTWDDSLSADKCRRVIATDITLRLAAGDQVAIDITACGTGLTASVATKADVQPAKSDQSDAKRRTMAKLGDSVYRLNTLTDLTGDTFIPQSQLAELRRSATAALDRAIRIGHKPDYRHSENAQAVFPTGTLTYHANVANALAKEFYQRHGATTAGMALETATDQKLKQMDRTVVMTTRYCLRGELGCCLKTAAADRLPARLFLQSGKTKMEVKCDCAKCEMNLLYIAPKS